MNMLRKRGIHNQIMEHGKENAASESDGERKKEGNIKKKNFVHTSKWLSTA